MIENEMMVRHYILEFQCFSRVIGLVISNIKIGWMHPLLALQFFLWI